MFPYHLLCAYLINLDSPEETFFLAPDKLQTNSLDHAKYQVVLIFNNAQYIKLPVLDIQPGKTYFLIDDNSPITDADNFSTTVVEKLFRWSTERTVLDDAPKSEIHEMRQLYYLQQSSSNNYSGNWITGKVLASSDRSPLPGVSILVKGTTIGTVTNAEGIFRIYAPENSILIYSFVGYTMKEVRDTEAGKTDVYLDEDITALSEIVVVGYGSTMKNSSTVVMHTISGKVAGITARSSGSPGATDSVAVRIRGISSFNTDEAIVILNGVPTRWDAVDKSTIGSIEVLKPAAAMALYGSSASNGVIIISTTKGLSRDRLIATSSILKDLASLPIESPGNKIRQNFRDYAFWQPTLRTNKQGEASFSVHYPDDITGWNMHVIGYTKDRRNVTVSKTIQSFKPLAAQLALPQFLIQGDSALAIGKITNYTSDSVAVEVSSAIDDKPLHTELRRILNTSMDSILLTGRSDSLTTRYLIKKDAYEDGEVRSIKVLLQGTKENVGIYSLLTGDTTFTLSFQKGNSITLRAEVDAVNVILDEIDQLKKYPYECNEQLTSKLMALLAEKAIVQSQQKKFTDLKSIESIIKKLAKHQQQDGGWGWWPQSNSRLWITLHVAEALSLATQAGFKVNVNEHQLIKNIKENIQYNKPTSIDLKAAIFLLLQNEKLLTQTLLDSLKKPGTKPLPTFQSLLVQQLLQLEGKEPDWKFIESLQKETMKGNYYWGDSKRTLWDNDVDNSLVVFNIIFKNNPQDLRLQKIKNYLLENRGDQWRNTYESAIIIHTLLPAIIRQNAKGKPSTLTIGVGSSSKIITSFPYTAHLSSDTVITITKNGTGDIYFSAYQEEWNNKPEPVGGDFTIRTSLADNKKTLRAGRPTSLEIDVEIKKDAEYILISVPIPAGCSYNKKEQSRVNGEIHREYDMHETRIYCEHLRAGKYQYTISLLPRFKGSFTINPAKIEWMYFPSQFARDQLKRIHIR